MSEIRNSNLLGKITILIMVIFVVNTALALDGSGTEQDPWLIQRVGCDISHHFDYHGIPMDGRR